ncbi:MAG: hypothetical protein H0V17_27240 [Deltaproteobacteria bacterium]|nr:hypothetical protein [Deltaproteobacteria bacterium]
MWWRRFRYVLLMIALCSIATCPSAKRACSAKQHAKEADELLEYLASRVELSIAAHGHVPPTAAGPTPLPTCCELGGVCEPDAAAWAAPGWQALAFSIDGDYRYTYSYLPDPGGRSAIVRAVGDVDCDGTASLYEVEVRIDGAGVSKTWTRKQPYE